MTELVESIDPKRVAIVQAATRLFLNNNYRSVSMDKLHRLRLFPKQHFITILTVKMRYWRRWLANCVARYCIPSRKRYQPRIMSLKI